MGSGRIAERTSAGSKFAHDARKAEATTQMAALPRRTPNSHKSMVEKDRGMQPPHHGPRCAPEWAFAAFCQALKLVLSFVVMLGVTAIELSLLLVTRRETSIPGLPPLHSEVDDGMAKKGGQRFPIDVLDAADLEPETLRGYVGRSEPVIVKNCPPAMFEALNAYSPDIPFGTPGDKLLIDQFSLPTLGSLAAWLMLHVGKPVLYLARFSGGYKGGYAHIDSFPSYNFYYVRRGRKRVFIVPRQYNPAIVFGAGYDSVFVRDDAADASSLEWLDTIPGCYEFEVGEGDVLLFNNSACIHKFLNLTHNPEIFTMRLVHADASPLTLRNDCFNWTGAKYFTHIVLSKETGVRDTTSVAGKSPVD